MPTPRPIIATIADVKSGIDRVWLSRVTTARGDAEPEQRDADRQAHRQHRAEGDDEDDDRGEDAVDLAGRQLELAEQVAAVLDRQALGQVEAVALVSDRRAEVGELLERCGR